MEEGPGPMQCVPHKGIFYRLKKKNIPGSPVLHTTHPSSPDIFHDKVQLRGHDENCEY